MRIGIHQPNFLPWMGYFYKIALSDTFVLLDHVEYTKNSYTKRVKIHKANTLLEDQYLTVPLKKHSDHSKINELQIVADEKWQKKIIARVYETYHKAPHYHQMEPLMDRFFIQPLADGSFSTFNIEIIKYISEMLAIDVNWQVSSNLNLPEKSDDVNLDIVTLLDGTTYVSGMGGQKYQDKELFAQKNIEIQFSDFKSHFQRQDLPHHFYNKSIISYLANYPLTHLREIVASDKQ